MSRKRPLAATWIVALILGALVGLPGCGDDETPPSAASGPPATSTWSPPPEMGAEGSPDGDGTARTADALLGDLLALVRAGHGPADPRFARAVESVAAVLWDPQAGPEALAAARVHMDLTRIAGETAGWLAASPEARAVQTRRDATAVQIHDTWLRAAAGSAKAYAVWCGKAGAQLLRARVAALQERFAPAKKR